MKIGDFCFARYIPYKRNGTIFWEYSTVLDDAYSLIWMVGRLNFAKVVQLLSQLKIDDKLGTKYLNFLFI